MTVHQSHRGDDLLEERAEAIRGSGWGALFRVLQPHNACFWVAVALIVLGLGNLVPNYVETFGVFAVADVTALVAAGTFALVFLYFLRRADRWERTPPRLATSAFVLGGTGAAFAIALPGNNALTTIYTKLFGQAWAADWKAGLTAPFVEESAKGVCFLLLLGLAPVVIRTVYDGLIVGAYIGLGFQVVEDALYGQDSALDHFGADQVSSVTHTFALRAVTGVASHALYTTLFAAGLIYLVGTVAQPRRAGRGLALVVAAMVIHGLWDSASGIAGGSLLTIPILLGITIASILILLLALRAGGGPEREFMRAVLAPEVANGTVTAEEFDAMTGHHRDRRAFLRSGPEGTGRRHRTLVLRAVGDLVEDLCRPDGDEVEHSRSEVARIRSRR